MSDERCQVCAAHPGWAHADESARSEPLDTCKACLGSGTAPVLFSEVDVRVLQRVVRVELGCADAALEAEEEREYRLNILRMANVADALRLIVTTW